MKTSGMIRKLCSEHGMSIAELARQIGQSPQNFGKKLKRETVSREEMMQIAKVFGLSYEQAFTTESALEQNDHYEEVLVSKYLSEEIGFSIFSVEEDETSKKGYAQFDNASFARINELFKTIPHDFAELQAKRMSADTYKVIYDKGLGHLQQSAKHRDRFRANIVEFGTNNKLTGQAELEKFQLKISSPALAVFDIAAIITSQYYLARIDSKLTSIDSKLEYVQRFLEESKKSDLWANGLILKDISGKLFEIAQDDQYRLATLTTVQGIRRDALSNVRFYHQMMSEYVEKHFDKKIKNFSETKNILESFYNCFDAYCCAVYLYGFAYVVEIVLSQLTDESFLMGVKKEIESIIDTYKYDYTSELEQFIENVKSLNPGIISETLAEHTPVFSGTDFSLGGLLFKVAEYSAKFAAQVEIGKKKVRKEEIEKQFHALQRRTEIGIKELNSPVQAIDRMNSIYRGPVELFIDENAAFLKLPNTEQEDVT